MTPTIKSWNFRPPDVILDGRDFSFSISAVKGTYRGHLRGHLGADGATIEGIWSTPPQPPSREASSARVFWCDLIFLTRIMVTSEFGDARLEGPTKESVVKDLEALGSKNGRAVLEVAIARLEQDPSASTQHLKSLRPNAIAERQLSLLGKYRVLFNVNDKIKTVTILLVGEKRGNSLYVQGERFTAHESRPAK